MRYQSPKCVGVPRPGIPNDSCFTDPGAVQRTAEFGTFVILVITTKYDSTRVPVSKAFPRVCDTWKPMNLLGR